MSSGRPRTPGVHLVRECDADHNKGKEISGVLRPMDVATVAVSGISWDADEKIAEFRDWLTGQGMSASTIKQRCDFLESRLRAWGTMDLTPAVVGAWLNSYHGWTRRTYHGHLLSIYMFLIDDGFLAANPIARIRPGPVPAGKPNPLAVDELERVLATADGHLRTWLLLAFLAGLRCFEIAKIRGEDITSTTLFVHGKGGQEAMLPTHPDLWALAPGYPSTGWWFPSIQATRDHISEGQITIKIRAHLQANGVTGRGSIHRLRHTYLTTLSRTGTPTRVIQKLARHKSLATTQLYLEVTSAEEMAAIRTLRVA